MKLSLGRLSERIKLNLTYSLIQREGRRKSSERKRTTFISSMRSCIYIYISRCDLSFSFRNFCCGKRLSSENLRHHWWLPGLEDRLQFYRSQWLFLLLFLLHSRTACSHKTTILLRRTWTTIYWRLFSFFKRSWKNTNEHVWSSGWLCSTTHSRHQVAWLHRYWLSSCDATRPCETYNSKRLSTTTTKSTREIRFEYQKSNVST